MFKKFFSLYLVGILGFCALGFEYLDNDLDSAIYLAKKEDKNVLMIFSADRCRYCQYLKADLPTLETNDYVVCIIDTDKNPQITKSFKVSSLPTSIIISVKSGDQKIISRNSGYSKSSYQSWLNKNK